MVPKRVTVAEVSRGFRGYINRVTRRGESFILYRGGRPLAELRPIAAGCKIGDLRAILAASPHLTPKEAHAFAQDIQAARKSLCVPGLVVEDWSRHTPGSGE